MNAQCAEAPAPARLGDLLTEQRILTGLAPSGKRDLLRAMVDRLAALGDVTDSEAVLSSLIRRERLTTTGLGSGYAVPRAFSAGVRELLLAVAAIPSGVEYKALDGRPVRFAFLILGPPETQSRNLRLLARLARMLDDERFAVALREAGQDPGAILSAFRKHEDEIERRFGPMFVVAP